ncbi:AraC-type DNA-binding protein [Apibacter mensalis]|uniref:AraC-type DNA-binding protein n=1 Tax=Apibacter mensalis TaxID=1586267 RepID=A0A0X3AQ39_9FLAO|nr:helix-turn-helix domain-containing protein [Apibacter mensalis]CVK16476.1 AraC-type DNA-binding protein [Apibacter mensalis]
MGQIEALIFAYSDIFFSYYLNTESVCTKMVRNHSLVYIYSGEYILEENGVQTAIGAGECIFLRKDNRVKMTKLPKDGEWFKSIFMIFKRNFLKEVFQKLNKQEIPLNVERFESSIVKLPKVPSIESLFLSLTPYFNSSIKPQDDIMKLKQMEGLYSLLKIDKKFYSSLFDFNEPWKIDIMEFMNGNYMYNLSLEEIAHFTGRSLASFKRDFKKISPLSPHKWLMQKRLQVAREKIMIEGKKVSDVYLEVGFKDLSHFSRAYKETFGYSPTQKN